MEFNLKTKDEFVFDEKNNAFLTLRKESWNDKEYKLSLRKCFIDKEGNESPNKGFAFLTEEGPHALTEELVRRGYGNKKELLKILENRVEEDNNQEDEDEYFDPKDIFAGGVGGYID